MAGRQGEVTRNNQAGRRLGSDSDAFVRVRDGSDGRA